MLNISYNSPRMEPSVPKKPIIEPFRKASVEVKILFPICGPKRRKIKRNGLDTNHVDKPQFFSVTGVINFFFCTHLSDIPPIIECVTGENCTRPVLRMTNTKSSCNRSQGHSQPDIVD